MTQRYYFDPSNPLTWKGRGNWKPCELCTCEDFPKCEGMEMCLLGELPWDEIKTEDKP